MRNPQALGVAAVAVLAMTAFMASAASAKEFKSTGYTVSVTGTQEGNHVFDAAGNSITCKKAMFDGQLSTASETLTVEAGYAECTAFGVVGVKVSMGSCSYELNANGTVSVAGGTACDANPITYTADAGIFGHCTVKVGSTQNGNLTGVTYSNVANGDVTVTPNVQSVTYTQAGALCGAHTDGRYTSGPTIVESYNGEALEVS
jgi:hypothetical protein